MKKFEKRPRTDETTGARTGPRARAAQERRFADPYAKAERPARGGPVRTVGEGERRPAPRPAVITLDADVARVFRDSETVNEVLRMVMRLARFGGTRPAFNRERTAPVGGERRGPPPGERRGPPTGERRGPPRSARPQERRAPPRQRTPRFKND
jgi:uncharacterized protein (DUF4415 family)